MAVKDWTRAKDVLGDALDRPAEERTAFVEAACVGNGTLRAEVERLLRAFEMSGQVLRTFDGAPPGEARYAPAECDGRRIAGYRLRRLIGEGGMGVVYLADQEQPRREVALKLIKGGAFSPVLRRRFEYEASVLGRLRHPGIAQIYEAGTAETETGAQPFFAMEYVPGQPLTRYADQAELGFRDRLRLLAKIAEAVHHAHQKGVIHRDLKPGNILVDEQGQPKILDFGVARSVGADERVGPPRTTTGQVIGTFPYISPEQCSADAESVDIRADVYALGVIGYELLAGRPPYQLDDTPIHEAARVICEQDPPPLGLVQRVYRGDIETIIAKALEKDRARRYQSAAEFRADLERYLGHEPITARPTSVIYQLGKFARRHRGVAAAVVIFVLGAVGTTAGMIHALAAQKRAEDEARRKDSVVTFYSSLFVPPKDGQSWGQDASVLDLLDRAAGGVAETFAEDPLAEATVRTALARGYWGFETYNRATEQLRILLRVRRRLFAETDSSVLAAANMLGDVLTAGGRHEEAEQLARQWQGVCERSLGRDHKLTLWFVTNLADALAAQGGFEAAERRYRAVLAVQRGPTGEHIDVGETMNSLARTLLRGGDRAAEAESLAREGHEFVSAHPDQGPENPAALRLLTTLGWSLLEQGRYEEADGDLTTAVELLTRIRGPHHSDTREAASHLARLRQAQGRHGEAVQLFRGP